MSKTEKFQKILVFLALTLVLLGSFVPAHPVYADGQDPVSLEVCVTWGRKPDTMVAGLHIWLPDTIGIVGKEIQFNLVGQNNPNYTRFGNLEKLPGNQLYLVPEGFVSDWSKKSIPLTNTPQTLTITVWDYDGSESTTLIYQIPSVEQAIEGIQNSVYGPCLGDWYN
ncbi:MAG: hypothetical protein PHP08_04250 [Candidatus Dojkabacteria bacterium]|nr:hypothetical protein [Candidatus Dojkabacteria bacterium]